LVIELDLQYLKTGYPSSNLVPIPKQDVELLFEVDAGK